MPLKQLRSQTQDCNKPQATGKACTGPDEQQKTCPGLKAQPSPARNCKTSLKGPVGSDTDREAHIWPV